MNCSDNRRTGTTAQPPFVTICEVTCPEVEMSFWVLPPPQLAMPSSDRHRKGVQFIIDANARACKVGFSVTSPKSDNREGTPFSPNLRLLLARNKMIVLSFSTLRRGAHPFVADSGSPVGIDVLAGLAGCFHRWTFTPITRSHRQSDSSARKPMTLMAMER